MSLFDPHMLLHLAIRWIDLAVMIVVVGGLAFDSFVMTPVIDRAALAIPDRANVIGRYRTSHTRLVGWALGVLLPIQFIDLVLRVQMMSGKPFSAVMGLIPSAVLGTHIGKVWLAKIGVLVSLSAVWSLASKALPTDRRGHSWYHPALVGLVGLLCLMVALAGHAADQGNVSTAVAADWGHIMAVSAWVGGLVCLRVLVPAMLGTLDEKHASRLFTRTMARFSSLAGWSLGILLITGAYGIWLHIHSWAGLTTDYGFALMTKLALVAPMIGLGALGRYWVLPALQRELGESPRTSVLARAAAWAIAPTRRLLATRGHQETTVPFSTAQARGLRFILFECVLVAGVIAGTAVLTQTMPPHVTDFRVPDPMSPDMANMPGHSMR